ncbi:MAG: hypothetical protein BACD_00184 [Bacteroides rodentium]
MSMKIKTCYSKITLNKGIFNGASFDPSLINFMFGKNGSGKTTISRCIRDDSISSEWAPGVEYSDVKLMVYNEDFIADNIQSYGNIPGVFTITKQSAEDKAKIDARNGDLRKLSGEIRKKEEEVSKITSAAAVADDSYNKAIWKATDEIRRGKYPDTQVGFKNGMAKLSAELERTEAIEQDEAELDRLYKAVYVEAENLQKIAQYIILDPQSVPQTDLIEKKIVGLSDTPFADFVKKIGALDWVTTGHQKFHGTSEGKCPYCQRILPDNFEEQLAACYDDEYKKEIQRLRNFVSSYQHAIETIKKSIETNKNNPFEIPLKHNYTEACQQLIERLSYNWTTIQLKVDSPGTSYEIADVTDLIESINKIAAEINEKIADHNAILADLPGRQNDCKTKVFQHMAFICHDTIVKRQGARSVEQKNLKDRNEELKTLKGRAEAISEEIAQLTKLTVNTTAVKDSINALIKSSGFQGFYLREKPGAQYVYELVRESEGGKTVSIARGLSEGERHFIAFLYFYHTVIGSQSDDGKVVPKIVVIDDPVSSLDSESMFIVAALTRELIGVCYNNYRMSYNGNNEDYIKQFFCLTHNPYFFREISYTMIPDYECVSFFEIKKRAGNQSAIEPCTEKSPDIGGRIINRNPVRSYYDSLWSELKTEDNPETLMTIIRQILEYYFIQMCGYKTGNLRRELIDSNECMFVKKSPDGTVDRTDYVLASAMISLLDSGANGFNEGLFFDSSSANPDQMRTVFRRLFELRGQQQHYYMMYGE